MRISKQSLGLCLALTLAAGCAADDPDDPIVGDSSLTIENDSSFTFIEINLSPVDQADFGSDLLGAEVLDPGDTFVISDIDCDVYDIRLVDEDSDECILTGVDLCFSDAVWSIDDAELGACVL
jgi:hypothetical protein